MNQDREIGARFKHIHDKSAYESETALSECDLFPDGTAFISGGTSEPEDNPERYRRIHESETFHGHRYFKASGDERIFVLCCG